MSDVCPRVWLDDIIKTCALASRSNRRITCIDRPPTLDARRVNERYEMKLTNATSEIVVADSANELSLRRIGQRISVVDRNNSGSPSERRPLKSIISAIGNTAIAR